MAQLKRVLMFWDDEGVFQTTFSIREIGDYKMQIETGTDREIDHRLDELSVDDCAEWALLILEACREAGWEDAPDEQ